MSRNNTNTIWTWLFNPFYFWGGSKLLYAGLTVIAAHIPMALFFNARFAGALDMHVHLSQPSMQTILIDVTVAWLAMAVCMYIAAQIFEPAVRMIDIAGATALARLPMLLGIIPAYLFAPDTDSVDDLLSIQGMDLAILVAGALVVFVFFVWFLILLFNALKVNSNLKGWKLGVSYISVLIVAEIISVYLIRYALA